MLDWGEQGHLAIALSDAVYVMDTNKGSVKHLCSMESDSQYISSVLWSKTGKYLAVGTSNAEVQVHKCFSIVLHVYKCYSCPQQQQKKKGSRLPVLMIQCLVPPSYKIDYFFSLLSPDI